MESNKKFKYSAVSKYVRISPFKVRRILDQIRGLPVKEALTILKFLPYKACPVVFKVLQSAIANAKQESNIPFNSLWIVEAKADTGQILKRFCPHAKGRGFPIKKRLCHITSLT